MATKVYITVPNTGWIHAEVCASVMRMMEGIPGRPMDLSIEFPQARPIENNRSLMANKVREGDYEWWVSIDDDNPPIRNPLELIKYDKDFIGLPTPCVPVCNNQCLERQWNVWDVSEFHCPLDDPITRNTPRDKLPQYRPKEAGTGLQRVGAVGTGAFVMRASILKAIPDPFCSVYDENGRLICGSDLWLCRKLRERGMDVFVHWDYTCRHWKETEQGGLMRQEVTA